MSERQLLHEAWAEYCDRLKAAGELIFSAEPDGSELDLATGIRYLSQQVGKGLKAELELKDALFPQLWTYHTPISKNFGDNPDCSYLVAYIDGSQTYRLYGDRGTVKWVRMNLRLLDPELGVNFAFQSRGGRGPGPGLGQDDLHIEDDGTFSVTIGPDQQPGNWLQTEPGPAQLMIRQFFGDWAAERPMRLRLGRVGEDEETPPKLTAARVAQGLADAATFVEHDTRVWLDYFDFYRPHPNEFIAGTPDFTGASRESHARRLGRSLNFCHFDLADDEALLIEFTPPPCFMWIFEQNNRWMTSVDYRYHFSSLNSVQATAEDDGSVRIVVSNVDPGIPNWLDPAGHNKGLVINRWVDSEGGEDPLPQTRVVKLSELDQAMAGAKRIDAAGRLKQVRSRLKDGVDNRFQL
jgi:hypothetical protein